MPRPCIVWIRNDLRLQDNLALARACNLGQPIIVLYIWSPEEQEPYPLGGASRAWLHDSLIEFNQSLNGKLVVRKGKYLDMLQEIIGETGARAIFFNRRYEPHLLERDKEIISTLTQAGSHVETFIGNLLVEPWELATKAQGPFKVFTPFYKQHSKMEPDPPLDAPISILHYEGPVTKDRIDGLELLTKNPSLDIWQPGEKGAHLALDRYIKEKDAHYDSARDYPEKEGTSRLSPHLHFGEISPRYIVKKCSESFHRQLVWREFSTHLLYHFPTMPQLPLKKQFARFQWRRDPEQLALWHEGLTGYPIVDAGMRELAATGWMHNRVRMIVGSFLVKHLLLPWQEGEAHFWEKLFDADLAVNSFNWQWVAGCGADASPYFRIFNPILQGQKFDPEGHYMKKWIPELKTADPRYIHKPWQTPVVELDFARMRALEAYHDLHN